MTKRRYKRPASPAEIALLVAQRRAALKEADSRLEFGISSDVVASAARRGEELTQFPIRPGEKEKPLRRMSGLDWLWKSGRIDSAQMGAGLKYGDVYRRANDVSLRSSVDILGVKGGDGSAAQEIDMAATDELKMARIVGLQASRPMIEICDAVAGEGARLRALACNDDILAAKKEGVLISALDLLVGFYGMR